MARHAVRTVSAVITGIIIAGAAAAMTVIPGSASFVDPAGTSDNGSAHTVSQNRLESYCDRSMMLADDAAYGDSAYQASTGDLSYRARYVALGSVYDSSARRLGAGTGKQDAIDLKSDALADDHQAMLADTTDGAAGRMLITSLLKAGAGTGQAGTTLSKAGKGDLRGISAASCVTPALTQQFLVPGTQTGASQRLIVTNPSSKATAVNVELYGTSARGKLSLSTGSTLTVSASGQSVLDLSAAAGNEDGLLVTVTSDQTPVAAVVRSVTMDGLNPHGSELATALGKPADTLAVPGVQQDDQVRLLMYSAQRSAAKIDWITRDGLVNAQQQTVAAHRVLAMDLGKAPQDALAVLITADNPVAASAILTREGQDGQQDYALAAAAEPVSPAAVAVPDGVHATAVLANMANRDVTATVTVWDTDGRAGDPERVKLAANSATSLDVDGAAVTVKDTSDAVVWAVRLTDDALDRAHVAGLSVVNPVPLDVRQTTVWSTQSQQVVR